ncbi:MAG: HAMP domain-containing histidine kinase [Deltaproteobacteria bacterium]|nr:HAMP domain-containing histidine kinase [Deltaproteobacteria bacterium]
MRKHMKRLWFHLNLQGKFRALSMIGLLIWLSNFSIIYFEIHGINEATLDLEIYEDLYNTVLEIRRYEKNFLLYQDRADFDETRQQFDHTRLMLANPPFNTGRNAHSYAREELESALSEYGDILSTLGREQPFNAPGEPVQEKIRTIGKRMVDLSHELLAEGKNQVAVAAHRALRWPVISMGLILVVFAIGAVLVNRKVIQPLSSLEQATTKIGRGDFGLIHHPNRIESEVDRLILAFNRMAEELEARQEQIIHSRKIASLGTLVSGVAHELNNPINNIILTIDSLTGKRKISAEKRLDMLNDILAQAVRASEIVKNLLDFSRSNTALIEELDIVNVLRETIRITENEVAVSNIKLSLDLAADLPVVKGNRQALHQVFINLLTNAIHAMPSGGELSVRAAVGPDAKIVITVGDTGSGIAEEHLPYIFDPFFTTKKVGQGTGLGLSVSYGIIKKHGGRITVDSSPGKGSTFTVVLPVSEETIDG